MISIYHYRWKPWGVARVVGVSWLWLAVACGGDSCKYESKDWCQGNRLMSCREDDTPIFGSDTPYVSLNCSAYGGICVEDLYDSKCVDPNRPCSDKRTSMCVDNTVTDCRAGFAVLDPYVWDCSRFYGKYCVDSPYRAVCAYLPDTCDTEGAKVCDDEYDFIYWICEEHVWGTRWGCENHAACTPVEDGGIACISETDAGSTSDVQAGLEADAGQSAQAY